MCRCRPTRTRGLRVESVPVASHGDDVARIGAVFLDDVAQPPYMCVQGCTHPWTAMWPKSVERPFPRDDTSGFGDQEVEEFDLLRPCVNPVPTHPNLPAAKVDFDRSGGDDTGASRSGRLGRQQAGVPGSCQQTQRRPDPCRALAYPPWAAQEIDRSQIRMRVPPRSRRRRRTLPESERPPSRAGDGAWHGSTGREGPIRRQRRPGRTWTGPTGLPRPSSPAGCGIPRWSGRRETRHRGGDPRRSPGRREIRPDGHPGHRSPATAPPPHRPVSPYDLRNAVGSGPR